MPQNKEYAYGSDFIETEQENLLRKIKVVEDYIKDVKNQTCNRFIITITRDWDEAPTSIYTFYSALKAVEAYQCYNNFGFAKEYLTIKLYSPNGDIDEKKFYRPPAGESSYIKENYKNSVEAIKSIKDEVSESSYFKLVNGIAKSYSIDNIRFNAKRVFEDCGLCFDDSVD